MKSLLFALGLVFPLVTKADLTCQSQSLSLGFSIEDSSFVVGGDSSTSTCSSDQVCGVAQYDVDVEVTTDSNLLWAYFFRALYGDALTASYLLNYEACADTDICKILTGGTDNCRNTRFVLEAWYPTSCNSATDYDALIVSYNASYDYGCCSDDNCNNDNYDFTQCQTNTAFTNYVSELFDCWNDIKKTFMKYLVCGSGVDIYTLVQSCYVSNSYDWSNVTCSYSLTCSDAMQQYLTDFGNCACSAATDNGFSGVLLAEFLQTQWETYCPNIELTCSGDGTLAAYMYYYYVYYTFYLGLAYDAVTDEVKLAIANAIAASVHVDSSLIEVEVVDGDDSSTEITITVKTQSSDDQDQVKNNFNSNTDSSVSSATGASVSGGATTTGSGSTQIQGSSANAAKIGFSVILVMIVIIFSLF